MYNLIKKEHLFIFLALFTALVLFTYFEDDFNYTTLAIKESCTDKEYQCCNENEGLGVNYFSLDDSCNNNQQCWTSCAENIKETNVITTYAVIDDIWNPIKNFFVNLFNKDTVGINRACVGNEIISYSEGHSSLDVNKYDNKICSTELKLDNSGTSIISIAPDDSHSSKFTNNEPQAYSQILKLEPIQQGSLEIEYKSQCSNGFEPLLSISEESNAHLGSPEEFNIKVCYKISSGQIQQCGNNIQEAGEQCDGNDLNDQSCQTLGFNSGTLTCHPSDALQRDKCKFDTSQCTRNTQCNNNGRKESNEQCDGNDFGLQGGSNLCNVYNPNLYSGGTLSCTNCAIQPNQCISKEGTLTAEITTPISTQWNVNQNVHFTGSAKIGTETTRSNTVDYKWNFGDGSTSIEQNPDHTYTTSGTKTVSFKVKQKTQETWSTPDTISLIINSVPETQCVARGGSCISIDTGCNPTTQTQAQYSCGSGENVNEFVCCVPKQICTPNSKSCTADPTQYKQCNAQGTAYNNPIACPQNQICNEGNCIPQVQKENCEDKTADRDGDGIRALFDSDCKVQFGNYISMEETIPSKSEAYIFTNIQVDCKYAIVDSQGEEKSITSSEERYVDKCISAYISEEELKCEETTRTKTIATRDNTVSFKKCNVGEIVGEEIPVLCKVNNNCLWNQGGNVSEEFIDITEYEYCSEINEGVVELSDLRLSSADEPGEELKIRGKVLTDQEDEITIEAALIDLENEGNMLKESTTDVIYEDPFSKESFEINMIIPEVVSGNYFVYIKAYSKNQEADTCTQSFLQKEINSDIEDEGIEFEVSCTDLIDNDNDELIDCEDNDCSTEQICTQQSCTEGQETSCSTNLPGVCSIGKKTCINSQFSECIPLIQPGQRNEVPGNNADDNCNGDIDEGSQGSSGDSDNDGLNDQWEIANFGTITLFNGNDDPDGDGLSNMEEFENSSNPNKPEKESSSLTWLWIVLGIIIVGVLVFIIIKSIGKPGSRNASYADPRLKSYVQSSLAKGFTKSQIKQALMSKGWSEKDIEKAIK